MFSYQLVKTKHHHVNKLKYQKAVLSKSGLFQTRNSSTKTMHETLDPIYNALDRVVMKGIKDAQLQNKKLLVAAGEFHSNKACLLTKIMLLSIAYRYLINTLYVEMSLDEVSNYSDIKGKLLNNSGLHYFKCYDQDTYDNISMLDSYLLVKDTYRMEIRGIDSLPLRMEQANCENPTALEEKNWITSREKYMRRQLINANTSGIAFFGLSHLYGFMEHKILNSQYHVVGMNISSSFEYDELLKVHANAPELSLIRQNVLYSLESKKVIRVPCLNANNFFMAQAVSETLQLCENKEKELGHGFTLSRE